MTISEVLNMCADKNYMIVQIRTETTSDGPGEVIWQGNARNLPQMYLNSHFKSFFPAAYYVLGFFI